MIPSLQNVYENGLTYDPKISAVFNNARGSNSSKYRIQTYLINEIRNTPNGGLVRIGVYSGVTHGISRALVNAMQRGVVVQVIIGSHSRNPACEAVRGQANRVNNPSFLRYQKGSPRGPGGNMHAKSFMMLHPGGYNAVMMGSSNLTSFAAARQYQDVTVVKNVPGLYTMLNEIFEEQALDQNQANAYKEYVSGQFKGQFFPKSNLNSAATDPVWQRLDTIHQTDKSAQIDIAQHAWYGDRGNWLAEKLVRMRRDGARVRVIEGRHFGRGSLATLRRGGIPVKQGVWPGGAHIHTKLMLAKVDGFGYVFTGSDNWGPNLDKREEVIYQIALTSLWRVYRSHFNHLWAIAR